jgi:hypothetical protein
MSVTISVCTKLPLATGPLCATRSASTKPGGGSSQPLKVCAVTLRRTAADPLEFQKRVARDRLKMNTVVLPGRHLVALSNPQGLVGLLLRLEHEAR